jgi:subtilisin family serine protease
MDRFIFYLHRLLSGGENGNGVKDRRATILIISVSAMAIALASTVTIANPSQDLTFAFGEANEFQERLDSCLKKADNVVNCLPSTISPSSQSTGPSESSDASESVLIQDQQDLINYCLENGCSPNIFEIDRDLYQRAYKPLSCFDVFLELKPNYLSQNIQVLAKGLGERVKVLHVIDLPNYKAVTVANSPNNPPFNLDIFDVSPSIPCPEYLLPTRTTSEATFLATVNDIANTDGVYLVDYFEFPKYDGLVIRLSDPNHPILRDSRFITNQIETHESAGHIAQVDWNQIVPNSVKRTVPINDSESNGQGTNTSSISADGRLPVDVDIAILDTGVSLTHPDLNVYRNASFVDGVTSGNDDQGHGSHVAGIAAAKDNSIGVVGIAPGARIWAIKICDKFGECKISDEIKGLEYATQHADEIDVLNVSIENPNSPALNNAIREAVNAGITVIVAAGNNGSNAASSSPANSPDVLSVSAIGDSDGQCGSEGPALQGSSGSVDDDSFAFFSNFGPNVKLAAPGVNVFSTYNGSSYAVDSGTSMAAPHVTGAAALYKAQFPDATPEEVISNITSSSTLPDALCEGGPRGYFTGDVDGINEPLLLREFRPS